MAGLRKTITASVLFTVFGGPGILLVLVPWLLTRFRVHGAVAPWAAALAGTLIAAGMLPLMESIIRFVTVGRGALIPTVPTEHLVVSGFYRWVRNPMYVGVLAVLAGEAFLLKSWSIGIEAAIVAASVEIFVRFYEEATLTRTFGEEYRLYCEHVPRWIPRLRPWSGSSR